MIHTHKFCESNWIHQGFQPVCFTRVENPHVVFHELHLYLNGFFDEKIGNGLDIVKYINKLPFQFHLPGHNYTGPGTNLLLNMEKNLKPTNKIDAAALEHDMAYHQNKNLEERHKADEELLDKAMDVIKNNESDVKEKIDGAIVSGIMKTKQFFGLGLETDEFRIIEENFKQFLENNKTNMNKINENNLSLDLNKNQLLKLLDLAEIYKFKIKIPINKFINNVKWTEDEKIILDKKLQAYMNLFDSD